jgi:protein-disulfide isomerase
MSLLKVPVSPSDHVRGSPGAVLTLVEYGDYQCPHCALAHVIVHRVLAQFGNRLRFIFRHFPLGQIHPMAEPAAETAEFAGAHGRFWEMHDALYENQDRLGPPLFIALAEALGLSKLALRDAQANGTYLPKVREDFRGGVRSGVNGTPTFFIGDRRHDGPYDFENLVAAIQNQVSHAQAAEFR